jgi:hypothetical protein
MARRRGNPNWGSGLPLKHIPRVASEFEKQVKQLGLTQPTYATSDRLRTWCKHNRNRCYIPEWLLKAWGIAVDPNFS